MRIFVYEHVTGGGFAGGPLPASLAREGAAMLRAVLADLAAVGGVSVVTTIDERVASSPLRELAERVELVVTRTRAGGREHFDRLASTSDGCLIVAPETDGILLERTQRARDLGARVLGSSAAAIRMASDKLELSRHLAARGIPCVPAEPYRSGLAPSFPPPWVLKPRAGAGSTDTYLLSDLDDRIEIEDAILTPRVPGRAASVLAIVGEKGILPLAPGAQDLSTDGRFRYLGGVVPLPSIEGDRATRLALRAIGAVTGLAGFVGVDLILGRDLDPEPVDTVVEINPRLTTSYVGLRALACANLAERWLEAMLGRSARPIAWRDGEVRFSASGDVREGART